MFPSSPWRVRALLVTLLLSTGLMASAPAPASDEVGSAAGRRLSLVDYVSQIDAILLRNDVAFVPQPTARAVLEYNRSTYQGLRKEAQALNPPAELRLAHAALLKAYGDSVSALSRYIGETPATAPASEVNRYLYRDAENAYAISDLVAAGCDIDQIARDAGLSLRATASCINVARAGAAPDNALGSALAPLSTVTLTHEPFIVSTPAGDMPIPRVRYTVGRIYAKANTPFAFQFINNNGVPFLFNLAVYRGNDPVLKPSQLVASTLASSGPGVAHSLTLRLKPGTYSFIDNVHPVPMRGKLIVVE